MKIPDNLIEKWMYLIFQDNRSFTAIHKFEELVNLKISSIISPEHIFLILIKKGYIRTDTNNLREYKEELESGLRPSALHFKFVLTEEGANFICAIKGEKLLEYTNNQLKLDI